jgi:hypothetical protein
VEDLWKTPSKKGRFSFAATVHEEAQGSPDQPSIGVPSRSSRAAVPNGVFDAVIRSRTMIYGVRATDLQKRLRRDQSGGRPQRFAMVVWAA